MIYDVKQIITLLKWMDEDKKTTDPKEKVKKEPYFQVFAGFVQLQHSYWNRFAEWNAEIREKCLNMMKIWIKFAFEMSVS